MQIRQQGNFIFIDVPVQRTCPARLMSNGSIVTSTTSMLAIDKKSDSWIRSRDPGVQFGEELVNGTATIVLDVTQLQNLAMRASRNRNKKAQQGPAKAAFSGIRTFNREA